MAIEGDTKDWTWVLQRRCEQCGVDSAREDPASVPALLRDAVGRWQEVLRRPDVRDRPDDATWSPLEYAAHVRDVFGVFAGRLRLMVDEDGPTFADWDQDAAAVAGQYASQDPAAVSAELTTAGLALADAFAAVPAGQWERRGLRSNGSEFTVRTLSQYLVHDVLHHLHDVRG
ncbi:DinB family protein [Georgenia yuyongxinii]|uniref:DinB family protein n=1 Tax=Georgenia yuyongxinii TaxID=2589797 RepID=A0A552WWN3_9MICO|nr:DinB family protein [Georgenia yuyongxinii]TRW47238.1 DinB family protein [Georgenia yuyongxinii]